MVVSATRAADNRHGRSSRQPRRPRRLPRRPRRLPRRPRRVRRAPSRLCRAACRQLPATPPTSAAFCRIPGQRHVVPVVVRRPPCRRSQSSPASDPSSTAPPQSRGHDPPSPMPRPLPSKPEAPVACPAGKWGPPSRPEASRGFVSSSPRRDRSRAARAASTHRPAPDPNLGGG